MSTPITMAEPQNISISVFLHMKPFANNQLVSQNFEECIIQSAGVSTKEQITSLVEGLVVDVYSIFVDSFP